LLPKEHRVVLVDREASFVFAPSFLWLMTGGRTAEKISRPLTRLHKKGIEVARGEVERIDAERREAVVNGRTITGDYLIVALGAELAPETIPGLAEAGYNFYTLAGAEALRDARYGRSWSCSAPPAACHMRPTGGNAADTLPQAQDPRQGADRPLRRRAWADGRRRP
jgi:NADPH-dependent 2,4-dienoyl-CoA reductase/sulfur reductase-like enzyme